MMNRFLLTLLLLISAETGFAVSHKKEPSKADAPLNWENTMIRVEVTSKSYNYIRPWMVYPRTTQKIGIFLPNQLFLTTADGLNDVSEIRLQKQGGGSFSEGQLVWIDYMSNLALVSTKETTFFTGLQPAHLASTVPLSGPVSILRWYGTEWESRRGEIDRMQVLNGDLAPVSVPSLRIVDTNIQNAGGGEAVVSGNQLIGMVNDESGDTLACIPSSFIGPILKARETSTYPGLGYFDFTWNGLNNPQTAEFLKVPGKPHGAIVEETGLKPGDDTNQTLHKGDVIFKIDGFEIDSDGNYRDPDYRKLSLENLSTRNKFAGASCKMTIWRDGKELQVDYILPKMEYSDSLLKFQCFDQTPSYVLVGGFVFVPLSNAYLKSWGADWKTKAPFRLSYYSSDKKTPERTERVVLSEILPDEINIGYDNIVLRNLVVDRVNGIKIKDLVALAEALKSPLNGFDVIEFEAGSAQHTVVLPAEEISNANSRLRKYFRVPHDQILPQPPNVVGAAI